MSVSIQPKRSADWMKLSVQYKDLPDGGEIVYQTGDPEVLAAVHEWFAAQLHDHGADATDHVMMPSHDQ